MTGDTGPGRDTSGQLENDSGAGAGRSKPPGALGDDLGNMAGRPLLLVDALGTVTLVMVTVLGSLWDDDTARLVNLVASGVLFVGGSLAFTVGFVVAAARSRRDFIHLAGLFYLTGAASSPIRRAFLGLWYLQIATATASVFTIDPPFGVMAPVWGIGIITWWAAAHGRFAAR